MLCLSEDLHILYHAEGGRQKFYTLPDLGFPPAHYLCKSAVVLGEY